MGFRMWEGSWLFGKYCCWILILSGFAEWRLLKHRLLICLFAAFRVLFGCSIAFPDENSSEKLVIGLRVVDFVLSAVKTGMLDSIDKGNQRSKITEILAIFWYKIEKIKYYCVYNLVKNE